MISCIVIDDEPLARKLLEDYISKIPDLSLEGSFQDAYSGLQFLQEHEVDVMFLDIQMPDLTGLGLIKLLKNKPCIILTTAYSEYALDGYDMDVTDYLLKPIVFERFVQAFEKAKSRLTPYMEINKTGPEETLFVKDGTKLVKVNLGEIYYIEGLKDYVSIYTPKGKIVSLQRMKNLEQELPKNKFLRIHHSYIIALDWIQAIHKDYVEIHGNSIPIGETYRKAFRDYVDQQRLLGEN